MDVDDGRRGLPAHASPQCTGSELAWRTERLVEAGFDHATARRLAVQAGVDLHEVLTLVDRGCPPDLAARIMTGMDPAHG
ncbi:hypothetical protein [Nocardioides terrisoli]|uniref:hypothetical protein n=1 Tax=Nocardioides terrisoli TaxID=3388267 RepID=UPI00287BC1CE|nr:hypothetical protein [Nocardioides marmorisolisilvae]